MKTEVEKRKPSGPLDYIALAITTFGVGYIPGAPGTYGSLVAVGIYLGIDGRIVSQREPDFLCFLCGPNPHLTFALFSVLLGAFIMLGIWASGRAEAIFGSGDPPQAVVDEVMGQLVAFTFVPFGLGWPWILAGFLLFRFFDIAKLYPANRLQNIPGGLGVCADDIVAGAYAGVCLAVGYAVYLSM